MSEDNVNKPDRAHAAPAPPSLEETGSARGCVWVFIVIIVVAAGGLGWWWFHRGAEENKEKAAAKHAPPVVPVVAAKATRGDLPIYLNGLGTVTALNTVTVHTRVDGELQKVAYKEGDDVKAGDLLVQIDPRPFEVQLTQAEGQMAKDEAALKDAHLDLTRYETAGEAATQQQRDTAAAAVAQSEGAVKSDQGSIDAAKLNLTYSRITAPISGRIGLRLVDQGNIVHASDANGLMVITQVQPITIVFSLPEDDLPQILGAQKITPQLEAEAWDRDIRNKLATGKLLAVDNQVDPTTGTVKLKAIYENKDESLYPNQFVNVRLLVDTRKSVVLIPAAAVQKSPQEMEVHKGDETSKTTTFVYVVKGDDTVEMRPIKSGPSEGELTSVRDGLSEGETVVTDGLDKLQPGMKVKVQKEPTTQAATTQEGSPATESAR